MRLGGAAVILGASFGFAASPLAGESAGGGCAPRGGTATALSINDRAEIVLRDGRMLKVAGIDVAHATADHPQLGNLPRKTLEAWLVGHPVRFEPLSPDPDRWGRIVADVYAPADFGSAGAEADSSVAFVLVDAGLARAKPSTDRPACFRDLVAAEATARQARLGVWEDTFYQVIQADDQHGLAQHAGAFVIVEGQVTRIGRGGVRTFVDFGPSRDSFTAVIGRRKGSRGDSPSIQADALKGKRLRIRGILDIRFGPRIEVTDPDEIERL